MTLNPFDLAIMRLSAILGLCLKASDALLRFGAGALLLSAACWLITRIVAQLMVAYAALRDDLDDLALAADALDRARPGDERLQLPASVLIVLCAQLERLGDGLAERVPLVQPHWQAIERAMSSLQQPAGEQ